MIVLVAPLDWGLGHATRCIPLIRALGRAGHTVIPCAGGAGARLLRAEFPQLTVEEVPGHAMTYTRRRALLPLWLLAQMPLYLLGMRREALAARRLARAHGAGLIITDGRYGFRAPGVPGVFVTHQLDIIPPGPAWMRALMTPVLRALNARALRRFDEIWVPDFPGAENLSGALGHPPVPPRGARVEYVRPLCRFRPDDAPWPRGGEATVAPPVSAGSPLSAGSALSAAPPLSATPPLSAAPRLDILALISGPEPQRTLLEERLRAALAAAPGTRVLVRGVPGAAGVASRGADLVRPGELNVFDHLPGGRLAELITAADSVVCRSGYTTVMELAGLAARRVVLIPTPGQPEQEYLAVHARARGLAAWRDQDVLDAATLEEALREAAGLSGFGARTASAAAEGGEGGEASPLESPRKNGAHGGGHPSFPVAFNLADWIATHRLLAER